MDIEKYKQTSTIHTTKSIQIVNNQPIQEMSQPISSNNKPQSNVFNSQTTTQPQIPGTQSKNVSEILNNTSYANMLTQITNDQSNIVHPFNPKPINPNSQSKTAQKKPDYSDDDKNTPKKDQGIIIETMEDFKIKQYLDAVGEIVDPQNIIYASRLSRDRICIYLKSKDIVNELIEKFDYITINETELKIRPLLLRATKFYLNRVCPSIPSAFLHDLITNLGINITSKIQREKMSNGESEFSHVFSFRRTFFGIPEKNTEIPESILVKFDQENHRIYIATEIKRCSYCFKIGHLSDVCKKKLNDNKCVDETFTNTPTQQNLIEINSDFRLSSNSLNTNISENDMIDITDMNDDDNVNASADDENDEHKAKRIKKSTAQNKHAKDELEKLYNKYVHANIEFEVVDNFLTQISKKQINFKKIREEYSIQIRELMEVIETLRGVTQSGTKARLTKCMKKAKIIFSKNNSTASTSNEINEISLYDELQHPAMESL